MRPAALVVAALLYGACTTPGSAVEYRSVVLHGSARIGSLTRAVDVHIGCVSAGGMTTLSIDLDLPDALGVRDAFDVRPFDSKYGVVLSHIAVRQGADQAEGNFVLSGTFRSMPATTFTFSASTSDRMIVGAPFYAMATLVRLMASGPGEFTWQTIDTDRNALPLVATVAIGMDIAAGLRRDLAPCLRGL